jgi:transposase
VTLADYLEEVDHVAARIVKLEKAIDEAVRLAPPEIRAVIEALQALREVAQTTAATIVSELGSVSRFQSPRQLMGYSGLVAREHSSGNRVRRGGHHQNGQQSPQKGAGGGGMGVSAPSQRDRFSSAEAEESGAQR